MESVRVLNRSEDYERLGINPEQVELWEDGRRRDPVPGAFENWYFDAILDDGSKAVVVFMPRSARTRQGYDDEPNIQIEVTAPDGHDFTDEIFVPLDQCETRRGECHVQYGPHSFIGDLVDYDITVEPVNGVGCHLHFHRLVKPFRPGTGFIEFGDDPAKQYTYLGFPRGEVTGSLTYDGATHDVHGMGYHDHQFHNVDSMSTIHHWLWGRQSLPDHTVFILDIVANAKYGFTRVPVFAVIDNTTREVIFENADDRGFAMDVEEVSVEEQSQKNYPKRVTYTYDHDDLTVQFTIGWREQIEVRSSANIFMKVDEDAKARLARAGLDPSYVRYLADAELVLSRSGEEISRESGDMIYEFAYFGAPDPRAHLELGSN